MLRFAQLLTMVLAAAACLGIIWAVVRRREALGLLGPLLGCAVDLGTAQSLKPRLRARVMAEAVHVV